jgi:hypothetical protein
MPFNHPYSGMSFPVPPSVHAMPPTTASFAPSAPPMLFSAAASASTTRIAPYDVDNEAENQTSSVSSTSAAAKTKKVNEHPEEIPLKRGKPLSNCAAIQCPAKFRLTNLYLIKIQIGDTSNTFCGIEHFNSGGIETSDVYHLLLTTEVQLKEKEKFLALPKTFKCGAMDLAPINCTNACSILVSLTVGDSFKNFCGINCLWKYLGLLSVHRWENLVKKHR